MEPYQRGSILGRRLPSSVPSLLDSLASNAGMRGSGFGEAQKEKIWVGVRVRPLLSHETSEGIAWRASDTTTLTHTDPAASATPGHTGNHYYYDRVFGEAASSAQVYEASSQRLVKSAMEGYNFTLFAYGQTGSGKTHTMRVIMRAAAADIFQSVRAAAGREFLIRLSAMEIYNEIVKDLLRDDGPALKVMEDPERGTAAEGLVEEGVRSESHLMELLEAVEARRHVRDTRMNASSSRSHQIVRIYIESKPSTLQPGGLSTGDSDDTDADTLPASPVELSTGGSSAMDGTGVTLSTINFVDLAGSERLSQAAGTEDNDKERLRVKEASNINRSLLTLGTVIRALGEATAATRKHVPYRDSKLTRLLQSSLSGNSRMAIICNISPAAGSAENTRAALHFANAAKRVTMRPKVNEVADDKATIRKMQAEIQELRGQLIGQGWFTERSKLAGALKQNEERVRLMAEQKEKLERQLANMQQFVLRSDSPLTKDTLLTSGGSAHGRRPSFDVTPVASNGGAGDMARSSSAALRASWVPGDFRKLPDEALCDGHLGGGTLASRQRRTAAHQDPLLLNFFLPQAVRRACARASKSFAGASQADSPAAAAAVVGSVDTAAGGGSAVGTPAGGTPAPQRADSRYDGLAPRLPDIDALRAAELQKLMVPPGPEVDDALTALQAEVRCITHTGSTVPPPRAAAGGTSTSRLASDSNALSKTDGTDTFIATLTRELERLESDRGAETDTAGGVGGKAAVESDDPELLQAVRTELTRLQRQRTAGQQASVALAALAKKVAPATSSSGASAALPSDDAVRLPEWLVGVLHQAGATPSGLPFRLQQQHSHSSHHHCDDQHGADASDDVLCRSPCTPAGGLMDQCKAGRASSAQRLGSGGTGGGDLEGGGVPAARAGSWGPRESSAMPLLGSPSASVVYRDQMRLWKDDGSHQTPEDLPASPGSSTARSTPAPGGDRDGAASGTPTVVFAPEQMMAGLVAGGVLPSRWDSEKVKRVLRSQQESVTAWYRGEVQKVQAAFRASAERDVAALHEAVGQYTEQLERVTLQKKLLLNQVLTLEVAMEDQQRDAEHQASLIAQLTAERDQARAAASKARAEAKAAMAAANASAAMAAAQGALGLRADDDAEDVLEGGGARGGGDGRLLRDAAAAALRPPRGGGGMGRQWSGVSEDASGMFDRATPSWADDESWEKLLPDIVELWEMLHVPLVFRSRFVQASRGKETFFCEHEKRRLEFKRDKAVAESGSLAQSPAMRRAKRALEWERKSLAANLKWDFNDEEREDLYREWGVDPLGSDRKMSLVSKLWSPATLTDGPDGMERSAKLVVRLSGTDAAEQILELVFGKGGEAQGPRPLNVLAKSFAGSVAKASKSRPASGASTPRRQNSSSSPSVASRVLSFLSTSRASDPVPLDRSILSGISALR